MAFVALLDPSLPWWSLPIAFRMTKAIAWSVWALYVLDCFGDVPGEFCDVLSVRFGRRSFPFPSVKGR